MYGAALTADGGNEEEVTMVEVAEATLVETLVLLILLLPFEVLMCFADDEFVPPEAWFIAELCL